ncbi:MAG: RNA polymerase sigma factor, partial [Gemmataceae bacterium]
MGDGCTTILEAPIGTADGELLERYVVQREPQAFQALVRRHQPRVLRVCRRLLGDEHVAEDVCQETFVVLARKAAELPWQRSIGPWLNAVARRLALNARTRARRRQHDPLDEDVVSAEAGPTARAEHRELEAALGSELGQLPDKYREPIVLCYLDGKTNVEAARELGWPTGSIARRLDRARSLLL